VSLAIELRVATVTTLTACSGNNASGFTLRVGATSVTGTPAGNLGWGDTKGILSRELAGSGLKDIQYSFFQSGTEAVSALLSGAIDVAAVGDNPALTTRGQGRDVAILALDSTNGDMTLIGAKGGPTTISGLAGKSIAAPQGTIRDRAARQLIEAAGLTGRIQVQDIPTPQSIAGLSSGSIDSTIVEGASAVDLQEKGYPLIDSLAKHGLGSTEVAIAQASFVNAHPGFTEAWQHGIVTVNKNIRDNYDEYLQWVADTDETAVEHERKATTPQEFNTEPFPADGRKQLQAAYDFLYSNGTFKTPFDINDWIRASS
jgi:sulfonate transport system substrate-binding protein